jgi:hypothetical protein
MGTATSRVAAVGLAILATVAAGCGSSNGHAAASASAASAETSQRPQNASAAFAWLDPVQAPAGWNGLRIPSGAVMYVPPGWQRERSDPGSATAALVDSHEHIVGYLNVTPHQGDEHVATWASFRVHHNAEEGDRDVHSEGNAQGLRFRSGRGACVRDRYTTKTSNHYIEIACLVAGPQRGSSVIVAAASQQDWATLSPLLERSISAFLAA